MAKAFIDNFKTSTAMSDSWLGGELDPVANTLCAPIKGSGSSNREGDKILITDICIKGIVKLATKSEQQDVGTSQAYRILLVLDTQTNGSQLNADNVMTSTNPEVFSFRDLDYARRFQILISWEGELNWKTSFTDNANTGSVGGGSQRFACNLKCQIPVDFKANNGDVGDIVDNSLHIIGCTESEDTVYIQYVSRVRFLK